MSAKRVRVLGVVLVVALLLVMGLSWLIVRPSASRAAPLVTTPPTVPLSGERIEQASPAAADFNGDGDKEIVIGGKDGMLYVLGYSDNRWSVVWSRQTASDLNAAGAPENCNNIVSDVRSAPAIADLDDDGHLEIVVTTGGDVAQQRNGGVLVYRYNSPWSFSVVSGWPQPKLDIVGAGAGSGNPDGCWDGFWSSPALGDLDGDGDLEVVVEGFDRHLHAWHHDGTAVSGWPICRDCGDNILRGGWASPALADLDGDGDEEAVFATDSPPWDGQTGPDYSKATVWAVDGDSSNLPGWPITTDDNIQSSPAIGDIDNDGDLEIVVGSGDSVEGGDGKKVYAWHVDGSPVSGWPKATAGDMPASPALGDLDGDGDLEIVIGCGKEGDAYPAPCNYLYAWQGDGSNVGGFPMIPSANTGWPSPANGLPYGPVLADYDGDGSVEILVVNRWSWGISTVSSSGQDQPDSALVTQCGLSSTPLVDDVDDDGSLEIVIGGATSSGSSGAIYIWDYPGNTSHSRPWPMFRGTVKRTGRGDPTPPRLVFPGTIRVYHQYGSADIKSRFVGIGNGGEVDYDWLITHEITRLQTLPSNGTVHGSDFTQLTISTTGLLTGWHTLGSVTVTGTVGGEDVEGSPSNATLYLYVGDVHRVYMPMVTR